MRAVRYTLWALTLLVISWALSIVSVFFAGKARVKINFNMDTEAGIVDE
jgi:hypothetical protein